MPRGNKIRAYQGKVPMSSAASEVCATVGVGINVEEVDVPHQSMYYRRCDPRRGLAGYLVLL